MMKEKNVVQFFIEYYRRFKIPWWLYLLSAVCGVVHAEIALQIAALLIRVNKGELYNSVIIGYVLLNVLNAVIAFAEVLLQSYGNQKIIFRARNILWRKILGLQPKTVDQENPSTLVAAVTAETEEASTIINMLILAVASIYGLLRSCITLYQYQAKLTCYMLLLLPFAVAMFYIVGRTQYAIMKKRYGAINRMTTFFCEHISAGKYVKAMAMEEKELESGYEAINSRYRADIYYAFASALQTFINSIYTNLTTVVLAVSGSKMVRSGELESTGINNFSTYMDNVNQYLAENLTQYQAVMGTKGALSHVNKVLNMQQECPQQGEEWKESEEKDILFEHVCFGYQEDEQILKDITMRIPYGKATAVIGDNGSGKSTVMKLMQGLYLPDAGRITVAGNEIGKVRLDALRKRFGYVLQDNPIFEGTICDNMVYGCEKEISEEEVEKIGRAASIEEFVKKLPDGYNTVVGESGSSLSGGQRQRIAIARSLMQDPDYLVLDEAGANLDYETYEKVYAAILENRRGKTMVFIAHDMHEVMDADYIIAMHQGQVEACGTHEELSKSSRTYQDYLAKMGLQEDEE